eukprot:jgi/Botrbrau1/2889/Bobra.0036s0031.1
MEPLKVYGWGPRLWKVLTTASFAGVPIEAMPTQMGVTNTTPEYRTKFVTGKIPALMTPDGGLVESNAICRYIANLTKTNIYPRDNATRSQVDQWIDFSPSLGILALQLGLTLTGYFPYEKEGYKAAQEFWDTTCTTLDKYLETRTFFVGEHVSLADICMMEQFLVPWLVAFGADRRKKFPHFCRWLQTMMSHPSIFKAIGINKPWSHQRKT